MKRAWHIWGAFGLCLAVALGAIAWVSATAMRLDRAQRDAARQAAVEENVRLALWRMDSALSMIVARESSQPYYAYNAFYAPERAYTRDLAPMQPGAAVLASPLSSPPPARVLLYFQFGPNGQLTSPQVPPSAGGKSAAKSATASEHGSAAVFLAKLQSLVTRDALAALIPKGMSRLVVSPPRLPESSRAVIANRSQPSQALEAQAPRQQMARQQSIEAQQGPTQAEQLARNEVEFQARGNAFRDSQQAAVQQEQAVGAFSNVARSSGEGVMTAVWIRNDRFAIKNNLFLLRRVTVDGRDYIQGCWLDWEEMKIWLLQSVSDLLPAPDLLPVVPGEAVDPSRMLAAIPARLIPGPVPQAGQVPSSPVMLSLVIAWASVLAAAAAAAALLWGAIALSERRGAFVSAVTHELRTPLTTFLLYTEMLDEGMLPEEKRNGYVTALRNEAERLSHLVENVLAYSQLEGNRARAHVEDVALGDLLGRPCERLRQRAAESGMEIVCDVSNAAHLEVRADRGAVERILFNLVDNACKYASAAGDRRIHVDAAPRGVVAAITVRDHGPGVSDDAAHRLFRPFSKSAHDAANSAPGVGLGLSLCRRLARSLGGDLVLDKHDGPGASFTLTLPLK